jgi:formate dehydrogenase subunit gamma
VRETIRFDNGDTTWLARWPRAIVSGRFGRHDGHFDPGQRVANVAIVLSLLTLVASGVGLSVVSGGPAFVWLRQVHTWATFVVTPLIAGHVLIAIGVLPGYRGVWRSMHLGGQVPIDTARRVWPGWTERTLEETVDDSEHPAQNGGDREPSTIAGKGIQEMEATRV